MQDKIKDIPMGISQWKEYGKKYQYWDYFLEEIEEEILYWINDWKAEGQPYGLIGLKRKIKKIFKKHLLWKMKK